MQTEPSTTTETELYPLPAPVKSPALRVAASLISYVFHPLFMPTLVAIAIYFLSPVSFKGIDPVTIKFRLATLIMLTVFFPLFSIFLMKQLGFVQSYHMRDPKDRIIPLITIMIFYFWVQQVFNHSFKIGEHDMILPLVIRVLVLGSFWGLIVLFILNIFFKISMHATAAGGMVGVVFVLLMTSQVNLLVALFVSMVLAGMIGTARLLLGAHRPREVWAGYVIGILVQLGAWAYLA